MLSTRVSITPLRKANGGLLGERTGDIALVVTVASGQDVGRVALAKQEVDDIQEAFEITILEAVTDGDEGGGNARSDPDSILDIEILFEMSVSCEVYFGEQELTASTPACLALCGF